jgi:hypothetical protein
VNVRRQLLRHCLAAGVDGRCELVAELLALGVLVEVVDQVAGLVLLVVLVATFTLPGQRRVVAVGVEPGADQRVAHLELVVQEAKGQVPVHGLDPERHAPQFHRQRIQIHAVQAALDDVALELRAQRLFKAFVGWVELQQFVAQQLRDLAVGHARHAAVFSALDQLVVV